MTNKKATNTSYKEVREKLFSFLSRRPCTRKQAEDFLLRSKLSDERYINLLINEAECMGLIDDLTFAKLFIEGHLSWGNAKISYELSSRGVERENINAALNESQDEISRASELVETWRKTGLNEIKIRTRLLSRGFSSKSVHEAIKI